VAELDVEALGETFEELVVSARVGQLDGEGADFGTLLVLDHGPSPEVGQKLMAPAGAEDGTVGVNQL
jgi:hypothetical protein